MASTGPKAMRTERRVIIEAPPDQVWAGLTQVDRYRSWWPWLRSLEAEALVAGDRWTCTVAAPLLYRVTFTIELRDVVHGSAVTAVVDGDVAGPARIELIPQGAGTAFELVAELRAASRWLQRIDRWAHPVARFGHDRIVGRALAEFATKVAADPQAPLG